MQARIAFGISLTLVLGLQTAHLRSEPPQSDPAPAPSSEGTTATLSQEITALLGEPGVAAAHWGISVTGIDGSPVFDLDGAKLFRPASTAKLFTTAAALALLGPHHYFSTTIRGNLDQGGTVQGDLLLVGGGDPSFGTADLPYRHAVSATGPEPSAEEALTDLRLQLTKAGVRRITGNILGDDTLFEAAAIPDGWAAEDLPWGYGTLPSALSFGDNEVEITVSPAPRTADLSTNPTGTLLSVHQLVPWLRITNSVITRTVSTGQGNQIDAVPTSGTPQGVYLLGSLAPEAGPVHEHLALTDSAAYAAAVLRAELLAQHVAVTGDSRPLHGQHARPIPLLTGLRQPGCDGSLQGADLTCVSTCPASSPSLPVLAIHRSAPLKDEVMFTLKTSANLHAELLLHHLALPGACPGVTRLQGLRSLQSWLSTNGLQQGDITLYDGSGLSTKDLVSPQSETRLLTFAVNQPWFPEWFGALPIGGVDGTLASRFTSEPLRGHVYAKTGTLGETRTLAGYVDCASGKRLVFSILVDNHQPGNSADRLTMDRIVEAIARDN